MTLREFVEHGDVGTRQEREAFETGLLDAYARALELVGPPPGKSAIDADVPPTLWAASFRFSREFMKAMGL